MFLKLLVANFINKEPFKIKGGKMNKFLTYLGLIALVVGAVWFFIIDKSSISVPLEDPTPFFIGIAGIIVFLFGLSRKSKKFNN
jgi:ABC-type enterochelin transport system permease subunit